jgi:heptosyltransferase-3
VGDYLVARTDKIGDVILSLPVAEAIKDAHPGTGVTFLVSPATAELARACPFVDGVIEYDETRGGLRAAFEVASKIRTIRPGAALFLRPTLRTALAAAIAGVPVRVGTAYRYYSALFTRRVREHRRHAARHEIEYNLSLVEALAPVKEHVYRPRIVLPESAVAYAGAALSERGLARGAFVAMHPGSARSARNLPPAAYARLADFVERDVGIRVLVTAGADEADLVREIDRSRKAPSTSLVGAPGLLALAAVIREARLFISGSTGPMHLAGAVGTPTLSFFSPVRSCSPRRWQPVGRHTRVILPPVPECPTCIGERCLYYDCMERIETQTIAEALKEMLGTER